MSSSVSFGLQYTLPKLKQEIDEVEDFPVFVEEKINLVDEGLLLSKAAICLK